MKYTISFLIVIFAILPTFSRDIKGRILGENNIPLDFVNVVLYCDSTYIAGGISDSEGNFTIPTAADVRSVICIRTKPPKGDGLSGTLRTDNGFRHYFRTGNSIDLKYRTDGLEVLVYRRSTPLCQPLL